VREQRNVVLAFRPSPSQLNFLGWVATSGAPYIDVRLPPPNLTPSPPRAQFVVTDRIASPPDLSDLYLERYFYLPPSYFPTSLGSRPPPNPARVRETLRFASSSFIFSAFNQPWKV
jgi:predicted O-linked N-acetylglucosamine transferase (SPINDLY family)